jgi:hypothetical protein
MRLLHASAISVLRKTLESFTVYPSSLPWVSSLGSRKNSGAALFGTENAATSVATMLQLDEKGILVVNKCQQEFETRLQLGFHFEGCEASVLGRWAMHCFCRDRRNLKNLDVGYKLNAWITREESFAKPVR